MLVPLLGALLPALDARRSRRRGCLTLLAALDARRSRRRGCLTLLEPARFRRPLGALEIAAALRRALKSLARFGSRRGIESRCGELLRSGLHARSREASALFAPFFAALFAHRRGRGILRPRD